jgi:hypothetical protein
MRDDLRIPDTHMEGVVTLAESGQDQRDTHASGALSAPHSPGHATSDIQSQIAGEPQAIPGSPPSAPAPAAELVTGKPRRARKAKAAATSREVLPSGAEHAGHVPSETHSVSAGSDEGAKADESPIQGSPPVAPIIGEIVATVRRRRWAIDQRITTTNRTLALIRTAYLGYHNDMGEAERTRLAKEAQALYKAALDGTGDAALVDVAVSNAAAVATFEDYQKAQEKALTKLVKRLPVYEWATAIRGLGDVSLGIIVGEAGDIGRFSNPAKLWKRMGLGLVGDNRQGNPGANASADDWIAHGYNKKRRSVMWNIGVSLLRSQSGEQPGPYRIVYDAKKADYSERVEATVDLPAKVGNRLNPEKWTPGRAHNAAQRYLEKRLLRNLWQAWRAAISVEEPGAPSPHAELQDAAD